MWALSLTEEHTLKRSSTTVSFFALSAALLAACGGGAGSTGGDPHLPPVTAPPSSTPNATTAQGTLVDDPSGTPLAGVPVRLAPWIAYPTPGPTPTPIALSTTDPQGHFTVSAPNGTYLLVIGPDAVNTPPPGWSTPSPSATDTPIPGASGWRATIHDRILLNGQTTLTAPLIQPEPLYTPPAVETNGAYRLATLDALTEAPCILAYNQDRISLGLPPAVVDEWLTENVRAMLSVAENPNGPGQTITFLTYGTGHSSNSGGANCAHDTIGATGSLGDFSGQSQALNVSALWFGGIYRASDNLTYSGSGFAEFPVDPRVYPQPSVSPWP